ncbi:MAG TPA: phosphoribosylamine--glycine ligase [Candidatus Paceibacterota bacterium]|nr:phosphoribosylamine--glycine ligase [Candidatus Paceibacterota bacterium]
MDNTKQKILIIGGGGREHAVGWKIAQSKNPIELFFAPGNAGTASLGKNIPIKATDIDQLLKFAEKENINLTLALPDDPLALGIVDTFKAKGQRIFGPTKDAARLESSKAYAKNFMQKYGLPTAKFMTFTDSQNAKKYVETHTLPVVVKVSGLALGKGVFICQTHDEAKNAISEIMEKNSFGEAGKEIVIEEFLAGKEISIHAFCDGENFSLFPSSQDHKRIGEGNTGPNTGGMGTIAPLPFVDENLMKKIAETIVAPTLAGMKKEGAPFQGILYPGLILTNDGPKILEYNARFGDPETQSYMRLLETDLLEIMEACMDQNIKELPIKWTDASACTIILASQGYPGDYRKGEVISGIDKAEENKDIVVFHAGTSIGAGGELLTNGGRVLGVSAIGKNLTEALATAYSAISHINFSGMQYRKDIGNTNLTN